MKLKTALASAALATSILAAPAHALSIGPIPGGTAENDFISTFLTPGASIEGFFASTLWLSGGPATINIEVFGGEGDYTNGFKMGSYTFAGVDSFPVPSFGPNVNGMLGAEDAISTGSLAGVLSGLLGFSFTVNGPVGVANGSNPPTGLMPSFFATFDSNYALDTTVDGSVAWSGSSVFLFLDDAGAGPDDNHDDLVVRLSIDGGTFHVPEPASLALLGMGLIGIGAARRRRNKA